MGPPTKRNKYAAAHTALLSVQKCAAVSRNGDADSSGTIESTGITEEMSHRVMPTVYITWTIPHCWVSISSAIQDIM